MHQDDHYQFKASNHGLQQIFFVINDLISHVVHMDVVMGNF